MQHKSFAMQLCSTAAVQARSRDTDCGKMDRMIELCGRDCDFPFLKRYLTDSWKGNFNPFTFS